MRRAIPHGSNLPPLTPHRGSRSVALIGGAAAETPATNPTRLPYDEFLAAQTLTDGRIVALGVTAACSYPGLEPSCSNQLFLGRYLDSGELDTSFGGGAGLVSLPASAFYGPSASLAVDPGGRILVSGAGLDTSGSYPQPGVLLAYTADGTPDQSFAQQGQLPVSGKLAIQPDGRILVFGRPIRRYLSDGTPDPSWDGDGEVAEYGSPGIVQADGKVVVVSSFTGSRGVTLKRYLPDGNPDPGFGTAGESVITLDQYSDTTIYNLAIRTDGSILASGLTRDLSSRFYDRG